MTQPTQHTKSQATQLLQNKNFLIGYKLGFGLLGFSAIVTEIATIVERGRFNPVNFFSYFTIEANTLAFATLILSAVAVAASKNGKLANLRGATTVYILIVGIGFSFLLAGLEGAKLTAVPWDNIVLHYIIPVAVLVDYLIDRPKHQIPFKAGLAWLLVPAVYLFYSLTRGAVVGWYPYPFLNPATQGYGSIALTASCLLVVALGLVWVVTKLSSKQAPQA